MKAQFITFEGIEGMGKSTHIQGVKSVLEEAGHRVLCTREPGGTALGLEIRALLISATERVISPESELLLMYADRLQHVRELIQPALAEGIWVLSDRFYDASFAYQGGGRGISMVRIQAIHDWALGEFKPDHTFLLDAPVSVSMQRLSGRKRDRIEQESADFFERVRQVYLDRAENEPERFYRVDATQPLKSVRALLKEQVLAWGAYG